MVRRSFFFVLAGLVLAGCQFEPIPERSVSGRDAKFLSESRNAVIPDFLEPRRVDYMTQHPAGTIVIDTPRRFLYLVEPNGKAVRYGVAVGDENNGWTGVAYVRKKTEWPGWTPTAQMHKKYRGLPSYMHPGPDNPMGARAMYLHDAQGRDTLYRIHGTHDPDRIGQAVSSGCIRLRNIDVIDLYERVPSGTKVVVL